MTPNDVTRLGKDAEILERAQHILERGAPVYAPDLAARVGIAAHYARKAWREAANGLVGEILERANHTED